MNARANPPAIGFELCFTGTARADAAAEPRQLEPAPTSRGSRYFSCASSTCSLPSRVRARRAKMSRISCVRSTTLRVEPLLQLAQLRRRELVVENDDVDVGFGGGAGEQFDLAAAEKRRGVGLGTLLQHAQHDLRAGGIGQTGQLFEGMLGVDPTRAAGDQTDRRPRARGPLRAR